MKSIITIFICIHIISSIAFAGKKRMTTDKWLILRHSQIEAYTDVDKVPLSSLNGPYSKDKAGYVTYHPKKNGRIKFADGSWIILTSHSSHSEDGIGDVTLIKASDGKYYVNRGHVCATMIIRSKVKIKSLKDFLAAKGVGDKSQLISWSEYKIELAAVPGR